MLMPRLTESLTTNAFLRNSRCLTSVAAAGLTATTFLRVNLFINKSIKPIAISDTGNISVVDEEADKATQRNRNFY